MSNTADASHHKRKQHPRKKKDETYTLVRESLVRNQEKKPLRESKPAPPLAGLQSLAGEDAFETDDIVFAFEEPEWSSRGFNRETSQPWKDRNYSPEEAQSWSDYGYTPEQASEWVVLLGLGRHGPMSFADAKNFIDGGIEDKRAAAEWLLSFHSIDAVGWMKSGCDLHTALTWTHSGVFTAQEKKDWEAFGMHDPSEVGGLKELGDEAALRWVEAGVSFRRGAQLNEWVNDMYTEKAIGKLLDEDGHSAYFVKPWLEENVPPEQIPVFIEKGYTAKRAAVQLKAGRTAGTAPDRRKGEIIPGKSWQSIKKAFEDMQKKTGRSVVMKHQQRPNGKMAIHFEVTGNDVPATLKYFLSFSTTGAFISGSSNISRKRRTVSTKAEYLRLHFPDS